MIREREQLRIERLMAQKLKEDLKGHKTQTHIQKQKHHILSIQQRKRNQFIKHEVN